MPFDSGCGRSYMSYREKIKLIRMMFHIHYCIFLTVSV